MIQIIDISELKTIVIYNDSNCKKYRSLLSPFLASYGSSLPKVDTATKLKSERNATLFKIG